MQVIAQQNDTLDLICWRHLGSTSGSVEQALKLNPGIADLGAVLPMGLSVILPAQPPKASTLTMINLWD
ncbi:tail protein X [Undibacterium rugosum]|uniref:tail protein X n=1 Tax=Undibacterium rugosum TaxID=2762291 RepID=UPI001B819C49|nr:tail protein X [Undibacterium rugosum]MBR7777363.1 tail protein X [Undibacterium rugosum]